jgi:hypothetical protein
MMGKQKAMRKKIFTLGISGGDLKRNSQARRQLLAEREQGRLQINALAAIGDTSHSAKELEDRNGRWLDGMDHAPLWLAETSNYADMVAMNMAWRESCQGRVIGTVFVTRRCLLRMTIKHPI